MQKRQNSLYPYLVLSDKTLIATKHKNLAFTEFQNFRGFVGSPWENVFPKFIGDCICPFLSHFYNCSPHNFGSPFFCLKSVVY